MTTIFISISFLIHILLILIIYFLYKQIEQLKKQNFKELEDILAAFLEEMKIENETLKESASQSALTSRKQEKKSQGKLKKIDISKLVSEKADGVSTSVEAQIFQLYDQGVNIEEIARKLGKGKTEVELMIKLRP